jgi:hypothetical protein
VYRWEISNGIRKDGRAIRYKHSRKQVSVRNDIIRARPLFVICLLMRMPRASPADHGHRSWPHERSRIRKRTVKLPVGLEAAAEGAKARPRRQRSALNKLMRFVRYSSAHRFVSSLSAAIKAKTCRCRIYALRYADRDRRGRLWRSLHKNEGLH